MEPESVSKIESALYITVFVDFCLGVAFYTFMRSKYWRIAGILEWIMAFTGTLYLWAFIGFMSVPEEGIGDEEREALLRRVEQIG